MIGIIICTYECNLSCKYCYEHAGRTLCPKNRSEINSLFNREKNNLLSYASAISALSKYRGRGAQIILHGGEPLLLNERTVIELLDKLGNIGYEFIQIQTNGTLLTNPIAEALKRNDVNVVISIDGPKYIHDHYRTNRAGTGTFSRVFKSVQLLKQKGVHVSALATITGQSYNKASEIYDFFNEMNLDFSINRCFPVKTSDNYSFGGLREDAYKCFLGDLYDLYKDRSTGDVQIPCFDRCLHDLKSIPGGYLYDPHAAPFISVYDVESNEFKMVGLRSVTTYSNMDDFIRGFFCTNKKDDSYKYRRYIGTLKECLIEHLCWQQTNDYYAALEVNT